MGAVLALVGLALWMALSDPGEPVLVPAGDPGKTTASSSSASSAGPRSTRGGRRGRYSGPGTLTGDVRRSGDDGSVAGQKVRLVGDGEVREALTDASGVFRFEDVDRGAQVTLEVDVDGFARVRVPARLGRHETFDVGTLWLAPAVHAVVEVDATGALPVSGATVEAFAVGRRATPFEDAVAPVSAHARRTDEEGLATFDGLPAGEWNFVVRAAGYERRDTGPVTLRGGTGEQRFLVTIGRGVTLGGLVMDRSGEPLRHVDVVALRRTLTADERTAPLAARARTGADGCYELDGLPSGDLVLWAARPGEPLWVAAAVRIPGVASLDLTLPDASHLVGRVVQDQSESPLAGVTIRAHFKLSLGLWTWANDVTDADGQYRLTFPGAGQVGEIDVEQPGMFATQDGFVSADRNEALAEGETKTFDVIMVAGTPLTGQVAAADDGRPVWGATVTAKHASEMRETTTDRAGRFRFTALRPGAVVLTARRWGFVDSSQPVTVLAADGAEVRQDLTLARGSPATGRVTDRSGNPIVGAEVCVYGVGKAACAISDASGAFRIDAITPGGEVWLEAFHGQYAPGFVKLSGNPPSGSIVMEPLVRVRGTVSSVDGVLPEGVYVQAAGGVDQVGPVDADWGWLTIDRLSVSSDGTFDHLVAIVDQNLVVRAVAPGYAPAESSPQRRPTGGGEVVVDLVLRGGETLRGSLLAGSDAGPGGIFVTTVRVTPGAEPGAVKYPGAWGPPVAAVSAPDGSFEVSDLPRGEYVVGVRSDRYRADAVRVRVPGGDARLRLERIWTVRGRVIDADGDPARSLAVRIGADGPILRVDADGRFRTVLSDARPAELHAGSSMHPNGQFEPVFAPIGTLELTEDEQVFVVSGADAEPDE